ncbi:MAG: nitroreductase family deazaflavin-dependent oxidoreductase [Promethearchaeota archaeon]
MAQEKKIGEEREFPRPGSVLHDFFHDNKEIRMKKLKRWKRLNKYLTLPLYRLGIFPIFGLGRIFLILYSKGRKSGITRKTPLEYHWINGVITIFSARGEESDWVKNIRANPDAVWVRHGFHHFPAQVEFITKESQKLEIIKWYVTKHPKAAKMLFGWNPKKDSIDTANFTKLINLITIMQVHPKPSQ